MMGKAGEEVEGGGRVGKGNKGRKRERRKEERNGGKEWVKKRMKGK